MKYHKLLEKQIHKLLTENCLQNPNFKRFIHAVNESYHAFDRDKELMNHAFLESEEEYQELLQNLNKENTQKQKSISKLYASLRTLNENLETLQSEDLDELTSYFSAQIEKRKKVEDELNRQFEFQNLLMNISSEYISIPFEEISDKINNSLKQLAGYVKADRAYIFHYHFEQGICTNTYEYCAEGIAPQIEELQEVPLEAIPEWVEATKAGKSISIPDVAALEDNHMKAILESQEIQSLLVVPMMKKDKCMGFVGFDSVRKKYQYSQTEKELLSLFANVLTNAEERLSMESNLARTVELLKNLLANLQYGILVEDENRKILFTNDLFCDMFSIPATPEDLVGIDCSNSAEENKKAFVDEEVFPKRINEILDKRKVVLNELLEMKDGRFLERDYIPIFIKNQYRGHLWKYNDITDRIITQQLLKQSEERNRLIMDSAINAIVAVDAKGNITFWNKSAETTFGWSKEEVLGQKLSNIIIPESFRAKHDEALQRYVETRKATVINRQMELEAMRKGGVHFPVEISIIPIEQNDKIFFCSFIQDISVRKKAEHNLKVQEEKYRNIIANMNLGLLEVDNNEIIKYANQSFCNVSGYEFDEIVGKNPMDLLGENKKSIEIVQAQIAMRRQGLSSQFQIPIKNKRGELRWWVVSGAPNYDDSGNLIGSIGIHLDITEQKKLEEEYIKEKEKALEASKAKEAFLANMSHEIRTPLNAIIGFLRELSKQELTTLQKHYIENSSKASQHLLSIINNILDISKIEAGEMVLENNPFSLHELVNNVVAILRPKVIQKNVKLLSNWDTKLAAVFSGDSMKIEQILYNLIGNAMKFTNEGEIVVNCNLLNNSRNYQEVEIVVRDTGIGMSKEFIANIFKKFYQEDESIARRFGGTGLGMAVTQELVKLMGGDIEIISEKEKGTAIIIKIKLDKNFDTHLVDNQTYIEEKTLKGTRILLVEDNEMNRMVAQNSLHNFKCIVEEAENGKEAIAILKTQEFDIILMDIQMPELDGIETTKILREEHTLKTPIIALTANAFKTEIEKCKAVGMNDYITKPFTEETLFEVLIKHKEILATQFSNKDFFSTTTKNKDLLYDLAAIQQLSRGNEEFVQKMIKIFITHVESSLPLLHDFFEKKEYLEISKTIHKLKPSIEGLGIFAILDEVKLLEAKAKEKKPNHQLLEELFNYIEKTLNKVIEQFIENEL